MNFYLFINAYHKNNYLNDLNLLTLPINLYNIFTYISPIILFVTIILSGFKSPCIIYFFYKYSNPHII